MAVNYTKAFGQVVDANIEKAAAQQSTFENEKAYEACHGPMMKKVKVTFEVALDSVPGWGHQIEDHIRQIFGFNPYVIQAVVHSGKD